MEKNVYFKRANNSGPRRGRPVKSIERVFNKAEVNFKNMVWKCWFKEVFVYFWGNGRLTKWEKSFLFELLRLYNFEKRLLLSKEKSEWFSPSGRLKKWVKFEFSSCWNLRAFKICNFCQKKCLSRFSPNEKLTK